jgi:erythromycin esterase-like protein
LRHGGLEPAVGVVYRPETELKGHYFNASLSYQFDECIWLDETEAVRPITAAETQTLAVLHPITTEPT